MFIIDLVAKPFSDMDNEGSFKFVFAVESINLT